VEGFDGLNCHKVDDRLYRGAQPTAAQLKTLKAMGIKTVVNLREGEVIDQSVCDELGLNYVAIPMSAFDARQEHVVRFLKVMSDPANHPVFVHCRHGADRTGMMCAIYRVVFHGWEKDEAILEFTEGGYRFNSILQNLVRMVRAADANRLRELAGVRVAGSEVAEATVSDPLKPAAVNETTAGVN
jgi:protein tyrosine/serine phosphatase